MQMVYHVEIFVTNYMNMCNALQPIGLTTGGRNILSHCIVLLHVELHIFNRTYCW